MYVHTYANILKSEPFLIVSTLDEGYSACLLIDWQCQVWRACCSLLISQFSSIPTSSSIRAEG